MNNHYVFSALKIISSKKKNLALEWFDTSFLPPVPQSTEVRITLKKGQGKKRFKMPN